jgi:hypothetical protein
MIKLFRVHGLSVVDVGFVAADMCATYSTHANVVLEKKSIYLIIKTIRFQRFGPYLLFRP